MVKTICDFCGKETAGARPKEWGLLWTFFYETATSKQVSFNLHVCSKECLVKHCPTAEVYLSAYKEE